VFDRFIFRDEYPTDVLVVNEVGTEFPAAAADSTVISAQSARWDLYGTLEAVCAAVNSAVIYDDGTGSSTVVISVTAHDRNNSGRVREEFVSVTLSGSVNFAVVDTGTGTPPPPSVILASETTTVLGGTVASVITQIDAGGATHKPSLFSSDCMDLWRGVCRSVCFLAGSICRCLNATALEAAAPVRVVTFFLF
jgi:hypothetical protein